MKHALLILQKLNADELARIAQSYSVLYAPDPQSRLKVIQEQGHTIEAVLTMAMGLTGEEIAKMPRLSFIASLGVGVDSIDLEAAKQRNIVVVNGAGSNSAAVADHGMALLLAQIRQIGVLNNALHAGRDPHITLEMMDGVTGKNFGILGMGNIGEHLARRAAAFDMPIGYHNLGPKPGSPYRYFDNLKELAQWSDCLAVAIPGGKTTYHLINADILEALGPNGYLLNVGRGSVVDTAALVAALHSKKIRGAALDVYEGEPEPPEALRQLDNVTLTPHVAAWSAQAQEKALSLFLENIRRHFAGEAVLTPVS